MKRIIYSLLAAFILLSSCSKKDSMPAKNEKRLVKTSMDFGNNTDFTYDGNGRLVKAISGDQEITFTYSGNTILERRRVISQDKTIIEVTWTLNGKGLAISGEGSFWAPIQQSASFINTFNAEGQLTRTDIKVGADMGYMEYFYSEGNLSEVKTFDNNNFARKTKYYYPTKLINKTKTGAGESQMFPGLSFFGKYDQHLVEKREDYDQSGTLTSTTAFQYLLDADGYPTQRKVAGNNNTFYYHYN